MKRRGHRDITIFVEDWWLRCIRGGSQLLDRSKAEQGYDVFGDGPWYQYVSVEALWRDFAADTGIHCRKREFKKVYVTVTGEATLVMKCGGIDIGDQGLRASRRQEYIGYGKNPLTRLAR